jgi:hypothetical protein
MRVGGGSRVRAVVAAEDSYHRSIDLAVRQRRSPRSPPAPVASAGALCRHACLTILPYRCLPRASSGRRLPCRAAQDWPIKATSPPSCAASTAVAKWK